MRRMHSEDLKLKSVKIGDDKTEVVIPKEAFTNDTYGYYVNIKSINQSPLDSIGTLLVTINNETLDVGLIRNCTYTVGMYEENPNVAVTISGVVIDDSDNSMKPEMTFYVSNTTIEEALESTVIIGNEDFDLYIIKN